MVFGYIDGLFTNRTLFAYGSWAGFAMLLLALVTAVWSVGPYIFGALVVLLVVSVIWSFLTYVGHLVGLVE